MINDALVVHHLREIAKQNAMVANVLALAEARAAADHWKALYEQTQPRSPKETSQ